MQVMLEFPESVALSLHFDEGRASRRAMEMVALEGYRSGELSRGQIGEMLGIGYFETEQFLADHRAMIKYTVEELEQGSENLRAFFSE
jgi:predicted HTH domain antitoxin